MIHILWATIRPHIFLNMHKEWLNRSDAPDEIVTYVAVNTDEEADILRDYMVDNYLLTLKTNKVGVCYPAYQLTSRLGKEMGNVENDDIVIFASDDFLPPPSWDTYLKNKLKDKGDVGLMVRDGYQKPDSSNMLHPAVTIPIMTYGCLLKLNRIIYHPDYTHMFSDCELYLNLKELDLLYDDRLEDETVFEHLHHAAGKRRPDYADFTYSTKWKEDEKKWDYRKTLSVKKRLKLINNK